MRRMLISSAPKYRQSDSFSIALRRHRDSWDCAIGILVLCRVVVFFSKTGQSIDRNRQPGLPFKEFLRLSSLAPFMSSRLEQALRFAAVGHQGQVRRSSGVPYVEHVVAVAWILNRAGFDEDVVIAGLLHDLVEDTSATLPDVEQRFGRIVAELVAHCSEVKTDDQGRKRPWIDRKSDHLAPCGKRRPGPVLSSWRTSCIT